MNAPNRVGGRPRKASADRLEKHSITCPGPLWDDMVLAARLQGSSLPEEARKFFAQYVAKHPVDRRAHAGLSLPCDICGPRCAIDD